MSYNAQFVEALKEALNGLRTIHAVGEEWCSYIGQIPVGGVPYCGQEVTRSTYSALWSYAQAQGLVKSESEWQAWASSHGGNVPYYSSGNGSSTFRMPRLVGYVRGASGQSEAGSYVREGLPNIEGHIGTMYSTTLGLVNANVTDISGALYRYGGSKTNIQGSNGAQSSGLGFDASKSNTIYGNSSHVTPETSVVLFGVYAFGEVGNVDALDASTLASALARVESNLETKLDDGDKEKVFTWAIPDWSAGVDIAIPKSSAPYTVPYDGFYVYCYSFDPVSARSYLYVNGVKTANCQSNSDGARANKSSVIVPLKKGDVIYFDRSAFTMYSSTFYPVLGR